MIIRREEFARRVARVTGFTIKDSLEFVRGFEEALKQCAADGDSVNLSGTMRMELLHVKETRRKHPRTGEMTVMPPHFVVKLRPLVDLKRQVSGD